MNQTIEQYFNQVESLLIESHAIQSFYVLRREESFSDGKLRIKTVLVDGSLLEMFEYVAEQNSKVIVQKYSFHWQASDGTLISRWDNAPHYMDLSNAPHHQHQANGTVSAMEDLPDFLFVLKMIEDKILR